MPTEVISGPSAQFLGDAIARLSASRDTSTVQLPLFPSGQQTFKVGRPDYTPRGDVNTDFRPGQGNVNAAPEPATPLQTEIRSTPMASRLGAVLVSEEIAESLGSVALAAAEAARAGTWSAVELRQTVEQDTGFVQCLVQAFDLITPQKVAVLSETKKLKDKNEETTKVRRWRLHGYSRKRDDSKTSPPSPRKIDNVVSVRKVTDIISQGIHALTVEAIAMLGSRSGPGFAAFGQAAVRDDAGAIVRGGLDVDGYPVTTVNTDPSDWQYLWPDTPPAAQTLGDTLRCPVATTSGTGRDRVMRVRDAVALLDNRLDQWLARVRNARAQFPEFRIVNGQALPDEYVRERLEDYARRHWKAANLLKMLEARRRSAGQKMENAIYDAAYVGPRERVRTGPQIVSTRRNLDHVRQNSWFTFSGYAAFRAGRGRPPLPKHEWLARYRARLAKRNKTGRHRKGKGVAVPKTKGGWRPRQMMDLSA